MQNTRTGRHPLDRAASQKPPVAKAIAVLISLGITFLFKDFESMRYLGLLTLVLILVWIWAARYAGRKFAELEEGS